MDVKKYQVFAKRSATESDVAVLPTGHHSGIEKSSVFRQKSSFEQSPSTSPKTEPPYERRFSVPERFVKLVTSPSEAMKDVALAPDYSGPIAIVVLEVIVLSVYIGLVFSRISFTGATSADWSAMWGTVVSLVVGILIVVSLIVYVVFWLVKSVLVQNFSGSQSGWSFKTATSVTGYAYLADLIFLFISVLIVLLLMPSISIDTTLTQSQMTAQLHSQIDWIAMFLIPLDLLALVWKSYLGGLGAHYGTNKRCSVGKGFAVFIVLALIGWGVSILIRGF